MKLKKLTYIIIVCVIAAVAFTGCSLQENSAVREARDYDQAVNEDGIAVDLSKNPYYKEKISGCEYNEAVRISYDSRVTGTEKHARVLLPPDYDENKKYPVLYLLHGLGGSDKTWLNKDADIIMYNLFYLKDVPEMIVVFPNCNVNAAESVKDMDFISAAKVFDGMPEDIMTSLMPYINEHYSTMTDRDHTAIAGYSLGGRETLYTAFTNQETFGYVGAFSSISPIPDENGDGYAPPLKDLIIDESAGGFHYMLINVGKDDPYIWGTNVIEAELVRNKIPHVYYVMEGEHENSVWQNALYNYAQNIFTD